MLLCSSLSLWLCRTSTLDYDFGGSDSAMPSWDASIKLTLTLPPLAFICMLTFDGLLARTSWWFTPDWFIEKLYSCYWLLLTATSMSSSSHACDSAIYCMGDCWRPKIEFISSAWPGLKPFYISSFESRVWIEGAISSLCATYTISACIGLGAGVPSDSKNCNSICYSYSYRLPYL